MIDYDILNLRCREIPREESHVEGCDCSGGGELHLVSCSLWRLPPEQQRTAIDAAEARIAEHTAALNRRLHAALRQTGVTLPHPIPPAAMIEAVKAEFLAVTGMPSVEPADTEYAKRLIAAAFSVCEVREWFGAEIQIIDGTGAHSALWRSSLGEAKTYIDEPVATGRVLRRLVITTSAEQVDTEGAP